MRPAAFEVSEPEVVLELTVLLDGPATARERHEVVRWHGHRSDAWHGEDGLGRTVFTVINCV